MSRTYTIEALVRGLRVLSLFGTSESEMTLQQIVTASGLSKSTAFRILSTLEHEGYLVRDEDTLRYRPGLAVLRLGFTALSGLGIRETAHPHLRRLSRETGETASLSTLDGTEVIYLDRVRNRAIVGVVLGLGSRIPAHCASMGKAMLAFLTDEELEQVLGDLAPRTPHSITDRTRLAEELARVRQRGFAINDQELEVGLRAVAAPIWNHQRRVIAAINITGSVSTISRQRLVEDLAPTVMRSAHEISEELGFRPGLGDAAS
ncbi:MAG: IclR family transcriptional regulator [Thermoanaerobaculia bacterium]|nr:IclR family transcriptional regulator [Thermoanaerobaculia bacterium]